MLFVEGAMLLLELPEFSLLQPDNSIVPIAATNSITMDSFDFIVR